MKRHQGILTVPKAWRPAGLQPRQPWPLDLRCGAPIGAGRQPVPGRHPRQRTGTGGSSPDLRYSALTCAVASRAPPTTCVSVLTIVQQGQYCSGGGEGPAHCDELWAHELVVHQPTRARRSHRRSFSPGAGVPVDATSKEKKNYLVGYVPSGSASDQV